MCSPPIFQGQIAFAFEAGEIGIHFIIFANGYFDCFNNTQWFTVTIQRDRNQTYFWNWISFRFPFPKWNKDFT